MDLKENSELLYHGEINRDDETFISEELNLGLYGSRIRNAQSVITTERIFLKAHRKNLELLGINYQGVIPNPFNLENAGTLRLILEEEHQNRTSLSLLTALIQKEEPSLEE